MNDFDHVDHVDHLRVRIAFLRAAAWCLRESSRLVTAEAITVAPTIVPTVVVESLTAVRAVVTRVPVRLGDLVYLLPHPGSKILDLPVQP